MYLNDEGHVEASSEGFYSGSADLTYLDVQTAARMACLSHILRGLFTKKLYKGKLALRGSFYTKCLVEKRLHMKYSVAPRDLDFVFIYDEQKELLSPENAEKVPLDLPTPPENFDSYYQLMLEYIAIRVTTDIYSVKDQIGFLDVYEEDKIYFCEDGTRIINISENENYPASKIIFTSNFYLPTWLKDRQLFQVAIDVSSGNTIVGDVEDMAFTEYALADADKYSEKPKERGTFEAPVVPVPMHIAWLVERSIWQPVHAGNELTTSWSPKHVYDVWLLVPLLIEYDHEQVCASLKVAFMVRGRQLNKHIVKLHKGYFGSGAEEIWIEFLTTNVQPKITLGKALKDISKILKNYVEAEEHVLEGVCDGDLVKEYHDKTPSDNAARRGGVFKSLTEKFVNIFNRN